MSLTAERARELFDYDEQTGNLVRKVQVGSRGRVGDIAGTPNHGYIQIQVDGRIHHAHRIAWLIKAGAFPLGDIDHIDGQRSNNAWANLREVSRSVNLQNQRKPHCDSRTGLLGIYQSGHRFVARICRNGRTRVIGSFPTAEEAHAAYVSAKRELHEGCTL